jgi:hypothetical protein
VRQVLGYFVTHPAAIEGLEDVARWRLRDLEISARIAETNDVLEWLVEHHLLECVTTRSSTPLFRLSAHRRDEAANLLARIVKDGWIST